MEWGGFIGDLGSELASLDAAAWFRKEMLVTEVVSMFGLCPKVGALLLPTAISSWSAAIAQDRDAVLKCMKVPAAVVEAHQARP